MMFGVLGKLMSAPATAGAARLGRTPDIAARPAPICRSLRRVVELGGREGFALAAVAPSPQLLFSP
jgi:hypothetical protein